jgi:hypothetical protein
MGSPQCTRSLEIQERHGPVRVQEGALACFGGTDGHQTKTIPTSVTFSPDCSQFVTLALPSRAVHIFNFLTGKLTRTYDESLQAIQDMQQAGTAVYKPDDMDFGRRLATERELDRNESGPGGWLRTASAVWDESGNFVLYPTLLGIKGSCSSRGWLRLMDSDQHGHEQGCEIAR